VISSIDKALSSLGQAKMSGNAVWFSFFNNGFLFKGVASLTEVTAERLSFETAGAIGAIHWKWFKVEYVQRLDSSEVEYVQRLDSSEIEERYIPPGYAIQNHVWRIASEPKVVLLIGELKRSVVN
jgi:hypothetical protein